MFSKFKLFSCLLIAVGMTACSAGSDSQYTNHDTLEPIMFTAAESGHDTKGTIVSSDVVKEKGIGIFAFYQEAKSNGQPYNFNKYTTQQPPSFMYNQCLSWNAEGSSWTYAPVKYWPNAENDQLSFFAYAPYEESTAWEEDIDLVINGTGSTCTKISHVFTINDEADYQADYMWANPVLNQVKPATEINVPFSFSHLCAKVGFTINTSAIVTWTKLDVNSITVKGAYSTFRYSITPDGTGWNEGTFSEESGSLTISLTDDNLQNSTLSAPLSSPLQLNKDNSFLFLAPQNLSTQDISIIVTYTINDTETRKDTTQLKNVVDGAKLVSEGVYNICLTF